MNEFLSTGALIPLWILIGGMGFVIALLARSASSDQHGAHATAPAHRDHTAAPARPAPVR